MQSSLSIGAFSPSHDETRSRVLGLTIAAYAALTICYLTAAFGFAVSRSLWMDEILAVWVARLPSVAQVVDAVWHGSEFSPPTYDLLLHALFQLFGTSKIVARLPSIVAILVAATATARIVTRKLDAPLGVLVFGLVLGSDLFAFAIQARPYAIVVACHALALAIWADYPERIASPRRAFGIAALLATSVSFHIYGILGFVILGIAEAVWSFRVRRVRLPLWIAFAAAGLAPLAWLPLFRHLATFNAGDWTAPDFYARPTWSHLRQAFAELRPPWIIVIVAALLMAGALALSAFRPRRTGPSAPIPPAILAMTIALLATLPLAFLMSLLVTHAFSTRYALQEVLGFALLLALVVRRFPYHQATSLLMVPLLCLAYPGAGSSDATPMAIGLVADAPGDGPIVVGEGLMFLQLMEAAPPEVRARLVFLTAPPGTPSPDPTNEHQILRLLTFLPDLPVKGSLAFVADHPTFLELTRAHALADDIKPWIAAEHWKTEIVVRRPAGLIVKVETAQPHARDP